jgi:lipopolysaccharide transport system permease protein
MISPAQATPDLLTRRIQPSSGWAPIRLAEIWEYRELFYFFAWRDLKVRYKQTALGATWAVIQPLASMVVFSLFFGKLAKVPSDGLPYPLFSLAALVPWNFFAGVVNGGAASLVASAHLIRKVYFPRVLLPSSGVVVGLVDLGIALAVLVLMMVGFGIAPTPRALWLPLLLLLAILASLGAGFWLAAINVYYRDVRYVLPFLIQLWMFATPVTYPSSLLPDPWRSVYAINPMVGVVEGFRWALLGADVEPRGMIAVSSLVAVLLFSSGLVVFRRMERTFAEAV